MKTACHLSLRLPLSLVVLFFSFVSLPHAALANNLFTENAHFCHNYLPPYPTYHRTNCYKYIHCKRKCTQNFRFAKSQLSAQNKNFYTSNLTLLNKEYQLDGCKEACEIQFDFLDLPDEQ